MKKVERESAAPPKPRGWIKFICWFSRKVFDIHDYKKAWGGDGHPSHFYTYHCWNCGKPFGI